MILHSSHGLLRKVGSKNSAAAPSFDLEQFANIFNGFSIAQCRRCCSLDENSSLVWHKRSLSDTLLQILN